MSNQPGDPERSGQLWMVTLALSLAAFIAVGAHHRALAEDLRASDDNIWMYYAGLNIFHPDIGNYLNEELVSTLSKVGASDFIIRRARLRTGYAHNMLLPAAGIYVAGYLDSCREPSSGCSYDRLIANSILNGYVTNFCAALLITLACVAGTRSTTVSVAFLLTLASLVFLSMLSRPGWFVLFEYRELGKNIRNLFQFALNPGPQFSPFGFTPRNAVYLISLATVAWRSQGHYGAAYASFLLFSFIHQAMAALLFAVVLALDLLLRPHIFRKATVWPLVVAFLTLFVVRESLWEVMALGAKAAAMVGAGVAVVLAAASLLR
ncbi:MAG: hypothetical protein ACRD8U_10015, partial [Pyrinomonadaceae bacterium]